jgi:hypothetical protein
LETLKVFTANLRPVWQSRLAIGARNVAIILKTNLDTQAQAHVILFSTDLDLAYDKIIEFYSLRFQIEFNLRDAKQYWGLEDFMNVKETAVTNAVYSPQSLNQTYRAPVQVIVNNFVAVLQV